MKKILNSAVLAGLGLLTIGATAQADILAGGASYGGISQATATCYIYNAGSGPVTIASRTIIREPNIALTPFFSSCAASLAAGSSCGFSASIVNNLAHSCRVVLSPSGAEVRGSMEFRSSTGDLLNSVELR